MRKVAVRRGVARRGRPQGEGGRAGQRSLSESRLGHLSSRCVLAAVVPEVKEAECLAVNWRPLGAARRVPDAWLLIGNCSADVFGGIAVAGACCSKIQKIIPSNFLDKIQKIIPSNFLDFLYFSCVLSVSFLECFHN